MRPMRFLAVVIVAVSAVAGASTPGMAQMAAPSSTEAGLDALAGKWDGWWIGATSLPVEVDVKPDGTYTSRVGTDTGWGTFRLVNGVIVVKGHLSGADAPLADRTATATLGQKGGVPMLTGDGRTSEGPYSFTLTKR